MANGISDTILFEKLARLRFDPGPHKYYLRQADNSETELASVTTMISRLGLTDTSVFTDADRHNGTARHLATELDDLGTLDEENIDDELRPALQAWRQFRKDARFTPSHVEIRGFSASRNYAFTIDRVGVFGDKTAIIDIKGSSKLPTYALQLWLYALGWEELTGVLVDRIASVHLRKDGTSKVYIYEEETLAREVAEKLPAMYYWLVGERLFDSEIREGISSLAAWSKKFAVRR